MLSQDDITDCVHALINNNTLIKLLPQFVRDFSDKNIDKAVWLTEYNTEKTHLFNFAEKGTIIKYKNLVEGSRHHYTLYNNIAKKVQYAKNIHTKEDVSKYLSQSQEMSLAKAIKVLFPEVRDDIVRDFSDFIKAQLNPDRFSIVLCDTDELLVQSHRAPHTGCFTIPQENDKGEISEQAYIKFDRAVKPYNATKLWGSVWYQYVPGFDYYMVEEEGKPIARFPVYNKMLGRLKCSNSGVAPLLEPIIMKKLNIKRYDFSFGIHVPFDVPLYDIEGVKMFPYTVHDDICNGHGVCYLPKLSAVRFGPLDYFKKNNLQCTTIHDAYAFAGFNPITRIKQNDDFSKALDTCN